MMDIALFTVRLVLAAVFGFAGLGKLVDPAGTRQSFIDFGIPRRLASTGAKMLPLIELGIATALLFPQWARYASTGALALLVVLSAAVASNLARGRRPACHCFGQFHSAPLGWQTLARNVLFGVLAAAIAFSESEGGWPSDPPGVVAIAGGLLLAVFAAQTWFIFHLLRQHGRILLRLDALEGAGPVERSATTLVVGSAAPDFALPDLYSGAQVSLRGLRAVGHPVLITFVDPDCFSCTTLLPELAIWQRNYPERFTVAVVSLGDANRNRSTTAGLGLNHVLLQQEHDVADLYSVHGTPSALLVAPDGSIAAPLAEGVEAIRRLVASALPVGLDTEIRVLEGSPVY